MSKFLIIYPKDSSTDFLEEIIFFLKKEISHLVEIIRIEPNEESHIKCISLILKQDERTFFIFLGHGASNYLAGARGEGYLNDTFINESNLKVFKGKKVFFLSCRSSDLLRNKNFIKAGLGFGDLPSEYEEIETLQRISSLYDDITLDTLDRFKQLLNQIIKYSLFELVKFDLTLKDLFERIKLRINKKLTELIIEDNSLQNRKLCYMLYMMKDEMSIHGNGALKPFD